MITYKNSDSSALLLTTTPRVQFDHRVPQSFITEFVARMSRGQIRVTDYQGNELKIYYDYGDM